MKSVQNQSLERTVFFDHIRYLMVLLVVVLHAACAYTVTMPSWVVDDRNSAFSDMVLLVLDIFLMPVLFFIAGYFALHSYIPKGFAGFVRAKLFRLGVPLVLGVFLFKSLKNYLWYYSRNLGSFSLWQIFVENLKGALTFRSGLITSNMQFNHGYFWFISLLLFFFLAFAVVRKVWEKIAGRKSETKQALETSGRSILLTLSVVVVLITLLTYVPGVFVFTELHPRSWLMVGGVSMFQPAKVVLYVLCFGTGVYAYSRQWFQKVDIPGHFGIWSVAALVSIAVYVFVAVRLFVNGSNPVNIFLIVFMRNLSVFVILLALISFSIRFWNKQTPVNTVFAQTSYHTYLLHMTFVNLLQLGFFVWAPDLSAYIKFLLVSAGAIGVSVLTARYITNPYPKLSCAGIIVLFFILCAIL